METKVRETKTEKGNAEELLLFVQMLQAAVSSNLPLPKALRGLAQGNGSSQAEEWANELSDRISEGSSVGKAAESLRGVDQVLKSLLSVPDGNCLSRLLGDFGRHLALRSILAEKVRSAVFYPVLLMWLGLGNLFLLNTELFPAFQTLRGSHAGGLPLLISLLYCFDPRTWPLSLPIPIILFAGTILVTRSFFLSPATDTSGTFFDHLPGMGWFLRSERAARLQGTTALFLQAGHSLGDSIRLAAAQTDLQPFSPRLCQIAEAIERGEPAEDVLSEFGPFREITEGWPIGGDTGTLVRRLHEAAESNFARAQLRIDLVERFSRLAGLILIGVLTLILTSAFFGPYFDFVGGRF